VPLVLGDLGTFRDAAFGNTGARNLGVSLGFATGANRASFDVNFRYRAQRREIILHDFTLRDGNGERLLETVYSRDAERQIIRGVFEPSVQSVPLAELPCFAAPEQA